jgi:serine protease Do
VEEVTAGGPAEKAGIKAGDVIVAINGKNIRAGDELIGTVTTTPVGNTLGITVLRDGKRDSYKVVVGNLAQIFPDQFGGREQAEQSKPEGATVSFGMTIVPLTESQRENMSLKEKTGVRVEQVEPSSFAEDVGLMSGDVILSINGRDVSSVEAVKAVQATMKPGDPVKIRVMRRSSPRGNDWVSTFLGGTLPSTAR